MAFLGPSLRRRRVTDRPGVRVALAILLSFGLNAALLALVAGLGAFDVGSPAQVRPVAIAPLTADQWDANRAIVGGAPAAAAPRPPPLPAMPAPKPPEEREPRGQVVTVAPSKDSRKPKDSRFLSDRDNTVEKETRSRFARPGYERTLATPSLPGASAKPAPGEGGKSTESRPGAEGTPADARPEEKGQRLALAPDARGDLPGQRAAEERRGGTPVPGEGEGGQRRAGTPGERSLITPGTLARVAGGPAPDRLDGVAEGDGTFLNTVGWKYATYFNRIKQAVASAWDPVTPLQARDPDHSMFGAKDRFTLLGVTLDDTGHLKNVVVEQTSGVDFLDRAAMTAFRNAQPFMNPPHGIVDGNGEIKFSFGFFLEVGRAGLRLYRAPLPGQ